MRKNLFIVGLSLLLMACHAKEGAKEYALMDAESSANDFSLSKASFAPVERQSVAPKVIKTGELSLEVKNLKEFGPKVEALLPRLEAYVVSSSTSDDRYQLSGHMTLRVKAENLEKLMAEVETLALKTSNKRLNAQDVTEEYVDVEARIKTKMEVREKYQGLLKNAKTVEEILRIENELRVIQEELEARQARLKYLESQVAYSTLHVNYFEDRPDFGTSYSKGFFTRVAEGLVKGWSGFQSFLVGVVYLWPFILLGAIGVMLFRKWRKRKSKADG
jgi:hypothetical protein